MANEAAMDARKESKLLQDMVAAEKRIKSRKKKASGNESLMSKLAKKRKYSKTSKTMKPTKKTGRKGISIVKIYGHELYKGTDYDECGAEWFHIQYSNGDKECVIAVVVADEVSRLGADYILDNCLDNEERIEVALVNGLTK
jgi:hypothetical protein